MKKYMYHYSIFIMIGVIAFGMSVPNVLADRRERYSSSLSRKINKLDDDPIDKLTNPVVFGMPKAGLTDTYGEARSGGRSHEGIDIFAPRGALIASPTEAVVTKIADEGLGGIQVWTANPGKESFYYAHLNEVYPELEVGDELDRGDLIGFVGNTGNASLASPHLHLGIYEEDRKVINPYERMDDTFTRKEQIAILTDYIEYLMDLLKERLEDEN